MLNFFLNNHVNNHPFVHKRLFQLLSDQFNQMAFENMRKDSSKLRSYSLFKDKIGFEEYLKNVKNPETRTKITKFRLSNHTLMIETGRHQKIPKHMRFCHFCKNVENSWNRAAFFNSMPHLLKYTGENVGWGKSGEPGL